MRPAPTILDGRGRPVLDWVAVPAGRVPIGADARPSDQTLPTDSPASMLDLPAFSISRTPVTNAQYALFVADTGHRAPAHWEAPSPTSGAASHPVTYVDWPDVSAFCAWAGVRLPSEAEWEKAARGFDGRPYPWGSSSPDPSRANCGGWFGTTTKVGSLPEGASPYGVLDVAGNVWEWTASLAWPYPYRADDGREAPSAAGRRVLRGGSFQHPAIDVRCAARGFLHGDACDEYIGFRVAADRPVSAAGIPFDWVDVPGGPFRMGTDADPGPGILVDVVGASASRPGMGTPLHLVDVAGFAISRTPVTNGQYAAWVAATGARPPAHWEGLVPPPDLVDHPVSYVDWHEARAFCDWVAARLPTEVEWEAAAAGAEGRPFPWGAADPDESTAWLAHPADGMGTRSVHGRPAGATPQGVLDLGGNTWEWTSSLHWPYPHVLDDGREDPDAPGQRVLRGGSFRSPSATYLRCAFRSRSYPTRRRDHIGFRVARTLAPGNGS